jgi:hypothetical protein
MHRDPATGYLVDHVTVEKGAPSRGHTISATYAAYELAFLRNVRRSVSSQLQLYSNDTPDTAVAMTPLDAVPAGGAFGAAPVTAPISALVQAEADLFYDRLTTKTDMHSSASI